MKTKDGAANIRNFALGTSLKVTRGTMYCENRVTRKNTRLIAVTWGEGIEGRAGRYFNLDLGSR